MAGSFYARWVPPSKPQPKPEQSSPAASPVLAPQQVQIPEEPTSAKKAKKSKRKSLAQSPEPPVLEEDTSFAVDTPASTKNSKKRKRQSVAAEATEQDAEEAPRKAHKAVLSKFERVAKRAEVLKSTAEAAREEEEAIPQPEEELHDLVPIPQPAIVPDAEFKPTFTANPTWLAQPLGVDSTKAVPFSELGIHPSFLKKLEKRGFTNALAVQSVLLPMLRLGFAKHMGDLCVSARTGSGKTLAYLLPIIEALRDQPTTTLSAIIVVPTRQLVDQALKVAEELCAGTKLKVGTALGSVPFATEQKQLVKVRAQYDPERAKELHNKASNQMSNAVTCRGGIFSDLANMPRDHVPQYDSGVDVLICTPGRLVEHIESTTGFLLRSVKWLVIDEADQLLTQNFQSWATILMDALHSETPEDFMSTRESLQKKHRSSGWSLSLPIERDITKVVLSATMKKDLTKLGTLRLRRPKLVVVEEDTSTQAVPIDGDVYELPSTLAEYAVNVRDGSKKPLYLLYILLNHIFTAQPAPETKDSMDIDSDSSSESESSDSGSDSDSDSDSGSSSDSNSDSSSDTDSDSDSDSSTSSGAQEQPKPNPATVSTIGHDTSRVLIFAKSNENASRLSHLLSMLEPSLAPFVKTMTPSATTKQTQKLLKSFGAGKVKILIASDAASRGLDIPDITHVINYDIPSSITSYVHRVGRTARAGKPGQAVTLVTKTEAGWFWNQIARGENMKRVSKKVVRVELKERDVTWDRKRTYAEALQKLQGAVEGND